MNKNEPKVETVDTEIVEKPTRIQRIKNFFVEHRNEILVNTGFFIVGFVATGIIERKLLAATAHDMSDVDGKDLEEDFEDIEDEEDED